MCVGGEGTDCGISCSLSMGAQRDVCCLTGPVATQIQGEVAWISLLVPWKMGNAFICRTLQAYRTLSHSVSSVTGDALANTEVDWESSFK